MRWTQDFVLIFGFLFFSTVPYILYLAFPQVKATAVLGIFNSLQGFYNLFVYIYPKVANTMGSRKNILTFRQAFIKTLMSKGEKREDRMLSSLRQNSSSLRQSGFTVRSARRASRIELPETTNLTIDQGSPRRKSRVEFQGLADKEDKYCNDCKDEKDHEGKEGSFLSESFIH